MRPRVSALIRTGGVVVYTSPETSVAEAVHEMSKKKVGSILIMEEGKRLVGIFTERDLLERVVARDLDPRTTRIEAVMTTNVILVSAATPRSEVLQIMNSNHIRHIPISDGEQVLGVISLRDILRFENAEKEFEIEQLRQYLLQDQTAGQTPRHGAA
ncbi:MAG: CBS domain-containing protein [Rhodothermales bacterium]